MKLWFLLFVWSYHATCVTGKTKHKMPTKLDSMPTTTISLAESARRTGNGLFKETYRVKMSKIPKLIDIPMNVSWSEFSNVSKLTASAAYDIFVAVWKGQKVIIKSLCNETARKTRSGSGVEMEKEVNILTRLEHPHIIKILGAGLHPHGFQILEYLGGGTLHRVMKNRITYPKGRDSHSHVTLLPQEKMFEYGIALASALHHIHENYYPGVRLFHRDLKMQNIGLTSDGVLKVFDFGMSELIRKSVDENVLFRLGVAPPNGKALGTWPYTAPEVLRREKYNHKSDVYCYAIILYYIMVGKHPMRAFSDHMELKEKVGVHNGWRPSPKLRWPDELTSLFAEMWNNDVYVRPNMREVVERLEYINKKYPDIYTRPLVPRESKPYLFVDEVEAIFANASQKSA